MKAGTPFRAARMMAAAIAAIMLQPAHLRHAAFADLGGYKSRGKGRGKPFIKSCLSNSAWRNSSHAVFQSSNPESRECKRRARQIAARKA